MLNAIYKFLLSVGEERAKRMKEHPQLSRWY